MRTTSGAGLETYLGDGTSGIYVWGADFRVGSAPGTYQRIAAATDYATGADFPYYLDFDGVDDGLATASIDYNAQQMTIVSGVTKDTDASTRVFVANRAGAGPWFQVLHNNADANYTVSINDTATASAAYTNASVAAPNTSVVTAQANLGDTTGAGIVLRTNGVQRAVDNATGTAGSANWAVNPLLIGYFSTFLWDGRIFSLIVRGAASSAGEIDSAETYVASKTGVTL
jgi:hypothetical protein